MPLAAACATPRRPRPAPAARTTSWLECLADVGAESYRVTLDRLPFQIGRSEGADFSVPCPQISRQHAEIYWSAGGFRIRDRQSYNGTFVGGRRVRDAALTDGDIVHLAHREFRFRSAPVKESRPDLTQTDPAVTELPLSVYYCRPLLEDLLRGQRILTLFQPIVGLSSEGVLGYEALGRGTHLELSPKPYDLFGLAQRCELAAELSRLFSAAAVEESRHLPDGSFLFCNLHPSEMDDPALLDTLHRLRGALPGNRALVVEIHEDSVVDLGRLRALRGWLRERDILMAYDDFGAGQGRITELADAPPDFLKLNRSLIQGIQGCERRQQLVCALTWLARDLGSRVIAEGVETEAEAAVCRELGCAYGQGYLFGHPQRAPAPEEDLDTVEG